MTSVKFRATELQRRQFSPGFDGKDYATGLPTGITINGHHLITDVSACLLKEEPITWGKLLIRKALQAGSRLGHTLVR